MKALLTASSVFSIHPDFVGNYLPIVAAYLKGNLQMSSEPLSEEAQPFPVNVSDEEQVKKILVISLSGVVTKYDKPCEDIVLAVVLNTEIGLPWMVAGFARDEFLRPVHRLRLVFPKVHDVGKRKCSTNKPLAWKR